MLCDALAPAHLCRRDQPCWFGGQTGKVFSVHLSGIKMPSYPGSKLPLSFVNSVLLKLPFVWLVCGPMS